MSVSGRNCHSGRNLTLSLIKQKGVFHAKSLLQKVFFDCHYAKRHRLLPKPLLMSKLPIERLSLVDWPFTHIDIDEFWPLLGKLNKKTWANQGVAKRYGAIFTCLSSRALNRELAGDLSTDNFVLAFCRFISRRGYHKFITSDNGTNFVGVQWDLSTAWQKLDNSRIKDDSNQRYIMSK